ncbi:penicillin-binding protein 1A [Anoxybacillus calidus]|jgi:penicillin-binding protein 1A|uniref:Penicillin-binding protein 1A n=1 Tax=[Anoxybacillus] calidus TaxID=575178 RepID=A0A7V9YXF0_9BACL|nr:PBP1A family penicillin-binding protein [Anoxybacillus calidus]MBA2870217.1 penicillin-binding protein 1A [Anoxybacillus calidus]
MTEEYRSRVERKQAKKQQSKPKKSGKQKKGSFLKKLVLSLLLLGTIGMVSGIATFAYFVMDAPPLDEAKIKDPLSSTIYDMNGNKIAELGSGGEKRTYISYKEIPKVLEEAVLATEDVRFYEHHGLDFIRLGAAVIANVKEGFGAEGASTITQQVVKLSFLSPEKTLKRKAQEAWLAFRLEQKYSKQEILEMYLNKVYYSNRIYGVKKAAEFYFNKTDLNDLTLAEAALLAGLPQSPNNYNPYQHPEAAEKRRNVVLSLMEKHGFITKEEAEKAKKIPVKSMLAEYKQDTAIPYDAFIDQVIKEVTDEADVNVFEDGLKIYTTLDPDAQQYVEDLLNSDEYFTDKKDLQAGIALLDTKTGEIRALGGGRDKDGVAFGFNFATEKVGQPGSTIKPILDYGPAIEYLKWSTYHQLVDEPYSYSDGTPIKNWDGSYEGQMSMRVALAKSRNIPALKALQEVGLERAKKFANKLGMGLDEIYESYAVGGLRDGVSPLQMAGAYSAFGNNGVYIKPHAVKKIVFPDNTEIDLTPEPKAAMKDYTAYMITDMLKSVVKSSVGTGRLANVPGLHIAGKTGTTNYDKETRQKFGLPEGAVPDSWFVGYTPNYTAAVWTGFSKRSDEAYLSTREQKIPRLLFREVISHVDNGEGGDFKMPKSVVKLPIKIGTNPPMIASKYTPETEIVYECFVKGAEPTKVAEDKPEPLSPVTNLQAVYDAATNSISLSWGYNSEKLEDVTFEVRITNDKGESQVLTASDLALTLTGPTPGAVYTFEVTAVHEKEQQRSETVSTTVTVPGENTDDQNNDSEEQPSPEDNVPDDNSPDNNLDNNGQPNGNGNEDDDGDEDNGGNGNNSEQPGDHDDQPTPPQPDPTTPPPGNNNGNGTGTGDGGNNSGTEPGTNNLPNRPRASGSVEQQQ